MSSSVNRLYSARLTVSSIAFRSSCRRLRACVGRKLLELLNAGSRSMSMSMFDPSVEGCVEVGEEILKNQPSRWAPK